MLLSKIVDRLLFIVFSFLTFSILEPYLNQGGVYIIEDLHSYDGHLTKDWFLKNNKKIKLSCNDKLLIYEK